MVGGDQASLADLAAEWRNANDRIRLLETAEAGTADGVSSEPLPEELSNLAEQLVSSPVFTRSFAVVPAEVAIIDLDRLVVFQKNINLRYVSDLNERLSAGMAAEDLFRFCLPLERLDPPVRFSQVGQNSWIFSSPSNDFRFLGPAVMDVSGVPAIVTTGFPFAFVVLPVGYGTNYLSAVAAEGRLVLNNGSHRAYALRAAGITHAPALVQHVSRREELAVIASGEFANEPDRYLRDPRPPLLRDYFDEALRKIVPVGRVVRQLRVTFGVDQVDAPE